MKKLFLVAVAATVCLAMPVNAKTPDDRFCGMVLPEEGTEPQLILFKLKKNEQFDPELEKVIKENGGEIECGAEMRAIHKEVKSAQQAMSLQDWRNRSFINNPLRNNRLFRPR
jgi:hypothetical protein